MAQKIPTGQIIRILMTIALLIGIIVMKQRCGKATADLFRALDQSAQSGQTGQSGQRPDRAPATSKSLTPVDAAH